ncbi:MAG: PAS domain S-box protein [Nitrospiraceae bacterium]
MRPVVPSTAEPLGVRADSDGRQEPVVGAASSALLTQALFGSEDLVYVTDAVHRYLYVNPVAAAAIAESEALRGDRSTRSGEIGDLDTLLDGDRGVLESGQTYEADVRIRIAGQDRAYSLKKTPVRDATGGVTAVLTIGRDVTTRAATLAQLRANEERLNRAVEGASDALWDVECSLDPADAQRAQRIWWSPAIWRVIGLDPTETFSTVGDWLARVHPEDGARMIAQTMECIHARCPFVVEYRLRDANGDYRWIRARGRALWSEDGCNIRISGSCQDITVQYEMEQALRESEERYRRLCDLSPLGMFVLCEGTMVYANQATCTLMGVSSPEELFRHPPLTLVHPDCRAAAAAIMENLMVGRQALSHAERTYLRPDGTSLDVEVDAAAVTWNGKSAIQGMFSDISARKQAEAALRASEERFSKAFRAIPYPFVISDVMTGFVVDANRAACEHFDPDGRDLIGKTTVELGLWGHPSDRTRFVDELMRVGSVRDHAVQFRTKSGELREYQISAELIDLHGVSCCVTVGNDVTDRRRAEQALLQVAKGVSAATGRDFCLSLVRHLSESLGIDMVTVACPIEPSSVRVRTVAVFADGQWLENFEHEVPRSPCELVLQTKAPCCIQRGARESFPHCGLLEAHHIDSYFGVPMIGHDGAMLGLVELFHRRPLDDAAQVSTLVHIFASRAAVEIERHHAESALRQSEARYRTLVESLRDLVYLLSPSGTIVSINSALETRLGWTRREWIGRPFLELVHPEDRALATAEIEGALVGHIDHPIDLRLQTRSGEWMSVECVGNAYEEDGRIVGVLGVARDVTARKQVEAAMAVSRANLRRITDAIPGVVFKYRMDGAGIHRFEFASRGTVEQMGHEPEVLEADVDVGWNTVLPEDVPGLQAAMGVSAASLAKLEHDFRIMTPYPNGTVMKWLRVEALPERQLDGGTVWYGIFTDVTERRASEQRRRFAEFALNHAGDATFVTDLSERLVYANKEASRSLGYAHERLLGKTTAEWDAQYDAILLHERVQRARRGDRVQYETVHRRQDGLSFPVEVSLRYLEHEGIGYVCCTARDLTERRDVERRLRHADRLATLGTITAGVAHELNNPLFVITGQLHLIERHLARRHLKAIGTALLSAQEAANRATDIVSQFLYTAHAVGGREESCDVPSVVRKAVALMDRDCRAHHVKIDTQFQDGIPQIRAEAQALLQVLLNLLTNARHALLARASDRRIRVIVASVLLDGARLVECRVEDNGPGIPPDLLARIFDPFFTTKPVGEGTGLGLAICHRIVGELHGTIHCASRVGEGATFCVRLPVSA